MELINQSFDALRVNIQGRAPKAMRDALEQAKREAGLEGSDAPFAWKGVQGHVRETGTKGGYAYQFDTGPQGETWLFKNSDDADQWNMRVEFRAAKLRDEGYAACRDYVLDTLKRWGCHVVSEPRVASVDFACDFHDPEKAFTLDPFRFVCHSRMRVQPWQEGEEYAALDNTFRPVMQSNRVTSVTIGGKNNRQLQVYDKMAEQVSKGRSDWLKHWGLERGDGRVWRVEIRLWKDHLHQYKIKTFADLEAGLGAVLLNTLQEIRYVTERYEAAVTRSTLDPLWEAAIEAFAQAMDLMNPKRDRTRQRDLTREALRSDVIRRADENTIGNFMNAVVAMGASGNAEADLEMAVEYASGVVRSYILTRPSDWADGVRKRNERYHYLDDELEAA